MKKIILLLLLLSPALKSLAQANHTSPMVPEETRKNEDGLSLIFFSNDTDFSPLIKKKLQDAFFEVYPREMKRFNVSAPMKVVFQIDTAYKGVAETSNATVRFNPAWFRQHPEDIDVVTHEVMHIVQNYGDNKVPGWLTEGIADYGRYKFGVNNKRSGWKLPDYQQGQKYTDAYQITARFLVWLEKNKRPTIVNELNEAMRSGTYTPALWQKLTGKNVDELWKEYDDKMGA
ncbi:basic secretory protein-like protein [Mucilaginibacter paludis]|uniref:Basic Secretory Protein n=1 Tax=Mucilaginibacter paludis DSM 18603 TaxID=714943 RepID=H1Y801_9SPHI|nr:basic secretory protein-like protein [Mucilaginibacter paludis]EHQ30487.1 Basic Secretory Protein [Mucilaginibacter paludis DSM 18603]